MQLLRSLAFRAAFYITTALFLFFGSPLLLGTRRMAMASLTAHARTTLWLMQVICGTKVEVRGREKLPPEAALIAAKHQSAWDTIGLVPLMRDPAMIMKQELLSIPVYGWFCRKFEMIPIRRELRGSALRQMMRDAADRAAHGRDIVIFPEGTRQAPGTAPDYKPGVVLLYEKLGIPCVPVALNSGLYWPTGSTLRYPGTIIVEFLDPIPPGLPRREFVALLQERIETATARLMREGMTAAAGGAIESGTGPVNTRL